MLYLNETERAIVDVATVLLRPFTSPTRDQVQDAVDRAIAVMEEDCDTSVKLTAYLLYAFRLDTPADPVE
jgi:hypothetical protein